MFIIFNVNNLKVIKNISYLHFVFITFMCMESQVVVSSLQMFGRNIYIQEC